MSDRGQDIIDAIMGGAYKALGITHEEANRHYLGEVNRLTKLLKSADLQHIRLRAGLREALDGWARENDPADGDVLPSIGETSAKIADLRKLLGGEP